MFARSHAAIRRKAAAAGILTLAVALLGTALGVSAGPQRGRSASDGRPAQALVNTNPALGSGSARNRGFYTPSPVRDPTAAERAVIASRVYQSVLDEWVRRATAPPGPKGGPQDAEALFGPEFAERLGEWSLRWQVAQDNAAKSLDARYQSLSDHLARMRSLEDERFLRQPLKPEGLPAGRPGAPKVPRLSAGIARFFRPIYQWSFDRVMPEVVDFERLLNQRGVGVTSAERAEIAGRTYTTILDLACDRFLAAPRAGAARPDAATIFDAALAERLGVWSDFWRQAEDAAADDFLVRAPAQDGAARLAMAGIRRLDTEARPDTLAAHIERMRALEGGRFLDEALERAGRAATDRVPMSRLRKFAEVARFFRLEAESKLPEPPRPNDPDLTASSRAAAAGRIFQAILVGAASQYRELTRAGGAPPDARLAFDARLGERLGFWSIRWAHAEAAVGPAQASQLAAVRAHIQRMESLEDGVSLRDALDRVGPRKNASDAPTPPRELVDVVRFSRLEALWELERVKSR